MNKKIQKLKRILNVKVCPTSGPLEISWYDEETNTAHVANHSVGILELAGRPTYKSFSLAHELAHAVAANYELEGFEEIFGEYPDEYDEDAILKSISLTRADYHPDFLTAYGTFHPEEDFADCVGFYLTAPKKDWDKISPIVSKKMKFVKTVIEEILEEG